MADSRPGRERVKISPELVLTGQAGCRALSSRAEAAGGDTCMEHFVCSISLASPKSPTQVPALLISIL